MPPTTDADRIAVRCPSCEARIRAARALIGRVCPCPRCREPIAVRVPLPSDAEVALVDETPAR